MTTIAFVVTSSMSLPLLGRLPLELRDRGWRVHLVSSGRGEGLSSEADNLLGIEHHAVDIRRRPAPLRDFWALVRLVGVFKTLKPDVIVGATPKAGLLGAIAGFALRIPTRVYLLWGLRLETTSGLLRWFLWFMEFITASASTHIVAVSPSLRQVYLRLGLADPEKIQVVLNGSSKGVDLEKFRASKGAEKAELEKKASALGLLAGIPIVGYFGRLTPDKGLYSLAASRKILVDNHVDHQMLIVGVDEMQINFSSIINQFGRPAILTGAVDNPSLYYRMIDVLCLPTLREGLPNVCLEAAASGVPVITTSATGAIDSVNGGVTGIIVEPDSTLSLADALTALISDEEFRESLASASRPWVASKFSESSVVSAYVSYFEALHPTRTA